MDIETTFKNLTHEKKMAFARFAIEVANADGEVSQEEVLAVFAICTLKLGIDSDEFDVIVNTDYTSTLKTFSHEEAILLGGLLAVIAHADGIVSFSEVDHIKELLLQSGIEPAYVPAVLETITNINK